jgi:polysaccharide pyruvyl transferase WcaK-like protein
MGYGRNTRGEQTKPRKISLFGLFGQQNLGNDCTLQAMFYYARKYFPDAEFKCICSGPEDVSARYNIPAYPIRVMTAKTRGGKRNHLARLLRGVFYRMPRELGHWFMAIKTLKGSDILIVPGTGLLVDHTTGPLGYPYYVFQWSLVAKLCRCKLFIVSMGAGPIYHSLSRWFIKRALSLADYRSYRDAFSRQYVESIGFEKNSDAVYPDLAFSLPVAMMPESGNSSGQRQRPVIGVGVVDYYGQSGKHQYNGEAIYRDYIDKTATFVKWLYEHNYSVRVIIGDIQYDSPVRQDLIELIEKYGLNNGDGRIISEPVSSNEQLLAQLAKSDIVVSPRFHNIILALMLNKPVIALSHHEKFDSLMAGMGLTKYCHSIHDLDMDKLIEKFIKLEKNAEMLKPYIKKKTEEYRRALDEQYHFIFNNV